MTDEEYLERLSQLRPQAGRRPKRPAKPALLDIPADPSLSVPPLAGPRRRPEAEASMTALPEPSMAQRHARSLERYFTPKMGGPQSRAVSQTLLGGDASMLPFGIGLQEFVPFSPYVGEEAGAMVREGQETDSGLTTGLGLGLGALQALPVAKPLARGAKAAGRALGPKAAEMAEGYLLKSGLAPQLTAYHGTPHKFAPEEGAPLGKFRAQKIGTGEGAQAYGHGIYFAESPDVARSYQNALTFDGFKIKMKDGSTQIAARGTTDGFDPGAFLTKHDGDYDAAIKDAESHLGSASIVRQLKTWKQNSVETIAFGNKGSLYTVDIPDEMIPRMLDWDKPLSQQSKEVQEFAKIKNPNLASEEPNFVTPSGEVIHWSELLDSAKDLQNPSMKAIASKIYGGGDWVKYGEHMMGKTTGEDFYRGLSSPSEWSQQASAGAGKAGLDDAEASAALREAGIPGIRYLDAGSRDTGKGTRNIVVFPGEEKSVKIIDRKAEGGFVQNTEAQPPMLDEMRVEMMETGRVIPEGADDFAKQITDKIANNAKTKDKAELPEQDMIKAEGGFVSNPSLDQMHIEMMDRGYAGGGKVVSAITGKAKSGAKSAGRPQGALSSLNDLSPELLPPEQRAVIAKFGQKQEQEAVRQKKVEKAAKESESPKDQAAKPVKSKGPRVKVEPDVYRKMAEDQGDEAVLRAARAGKHLKPTGEGYIGAPRTVTSSQGLGAMRRAMDADFADSVEAVRLADPERLGTWYDRAKQGIAESTEPYQLPRTLEQHGVYSAGVSPESELTFALKHLNSRVAGDPQMAYRGAGMRTLDNAVADDLEAKMGFKIGEYANKNDPRLPNAGLFGVNDFRRAQGMGYTDPQGNPWKAGVSDTMHPFMDAETALQVDRANTAGTGGRTDWAGPHIQEVPWVYGKAQDLYSRGKRGRYGGDELEGIKKAIQDANNTARDYMYKHAASATHEQIPGASLGHVRQALDMTPEEKLAYGQVGRFDVPAPEAALNEFPAVGAGRRDSIYGALGYRQLPSRQAEGLYMNKLGEVETNPMTIARPLMDFPTGGGGLMAPDSRRMMDAAEQFRALMDAQEAGAYNLPNTMGGIKGKNSMVLDTRGRAANRLADPSAGALPTSEQLAKMNELVGEKGFGVTASNRGAVMFPFDATMDPKQASKAMRQSSKGLEKIFPSSQQKSLSTMGYVPGVGKRSPEGPVSTAPYSGEATADILKAFSELPPTVSQNLGESEAVREAIRAKALRDSKMGGTRGDIQETRRFFSEADWPKAVALMRKGMTPAAALAALGYSINAMAADER